MNYEERDVAMSRKVEATYYQERLNEAHEKNQRNKELTVHETP